MSTHVGPGLGSRIKVQSRMRPERDLAVVAPIWGTDPTGALSLEVDVTGWVVDVRLGTSIDGLRDPDGLTTAIRGAITQSMRERMVRTAEARPATEAELARGRELEQGSRRIVPPAPYRAPRTSKEDLFEEIKAHRSGPVAVDERLTRLVTGRSRDGEITVVLGWIDGFRSATADPDWLRRVDPDLLRHALKEAFAAATEAGDRVA